jgi:hypothetical protein
VATEVLSQREVICFDIGKHIAWMGDRFDLAPGHVHEPSIRLRVRGVVTHADIRNQIDLGHDA